MDKEQKFWISIWGMVIAVVVCLILCISIVTIKTDGRIESSIKSGVDTLEATFAFRETTRQEESLFFLSKKINEE